MSDEVGDQVVDGVLEGEREHSSPRRHGVHGEKLICFDTKGTNLHERQYVDDGQESCDCAVVDDFVGPILVLAHLVILGRHFIEFFEGKSPEREVRADIIIDGERKFSITPGERK